MQRSAHAYVVSGIELVRALGMAGIRSTAIVPRGRPARLSRFVADGIDPAGRPVAEVLAEHAAQLAEPVPLLFDSDETLEAVSRNRDALSAGFLFTLPDAELTEDLLDKQRFQRLAERLGLPVPAALTVSPATAGPEDVELAFPVALKPIPFKNDAWNRISNGAKAIRADDKRQLEALWPALAGSGLQFVAQELVPGPETRILSYHVYVDSCGEIAGEFTGRKIRTYPREFGASVALTTTDERDVAELGRELVGRMGIRGPAKLDLKRAPDGTLRLLEVNTRLTLWVHPGAVAGVNLAAIAYADLAGTRPPAVRRARPGVRWVAPGDDRLAAREVGIPLWRWVPWAITCETNPVFAWNDPGPLVRRVLDRVRARR